jgi:hypothetical protein
VSAAGPRTSGTACAVADNLCRARRIGLSHRLKKDRCNFISFSCETCAGGRHELSNCALPVVYLLPTEVQTLERGLHIPLFTGLTT